MAVPTASFQAGQTTGCAPFTVQFTNTSTGWATCAWSVSNGTASTVADPTVTFTAPGTYTVTLVVTDAGGSADSISRINYITVIDYPDADFSVSTTAACPDVNLIAFNNASTGATRYIWDFGDGTTSSDPTPSHTYHQSGSFTITLVAENQFSCRDVLTRSQHITIYPKPDATVTVDTTASCDSTRDFRFSTTNTDVLTWQWNFGDGSYSNLPAPSHRFSTYGTYPVTVILGNSFGCYDTSDAPLAIRVGQGYLPLLYTDIDTGCAPLTVRFTNPNQGISVSNWNLGDNSASNQFSFSHTYTQAGNYPVRLTMTGTDGCVTEVTTTIVANESPVAGFNISSTTGCSPLSVYFTNTSQNFDSCIWMFGDGSSSTLPNPTHIYDNSGNYHVTLQCRNTDGCVSSVSSPQPLTVSATHAAFDASHRMGCPPLDVDFTVLTQGQQLTYDWDFGDGGTSTLPQPVHTYTGSGSYDVRLIVSNTAGCSDTLFRSAYIQTMNPAAGYVPPPVTVGCAPFTTQFTDATFGAVSWLWDFGDGTTSSLQNPLHTYANPGNYTVALTTTAAGGGCVQHIAQFSSFDIRGGFAGFSHEASACPPYIAEFSDTSMNAVSWLWNFGDGTTSTDQHPIHTFAVGGYHSVSLNVTTADGCTYSAMQNNGVYFQPFGANFYVTSQDTSYPRTVDFHANSLNANAWLWDFGDGTTSTLENPSHVYSAPFTSPITLTIIHQPCSLTYIQPVIDFGDPDTNGIDPGAPGAPVVQYGCMPLQVSFTQDYRIEGARAYDWDFGDGETSNEQFPVHTYRNAGVYSVFLLITDSIGQPIHVFLDSIVHVYGPTAGFGAIQSTNCQQGVVTFADSSVNAFSWFWQFGDGDTSSLRNPVHQYTSGSSNHIVTQTVTDTAGCRSSVSASLFSNSQEPILVTETDVCGYDTVSFFTSMRNFPAYIWNFGDGDSSTAANPSHVYQQEGIYTPTLTTYDAGGCPQTWNAPPITVSLPEAVFTTTDDRQACDRLTISLINLSANADSYQWNFGDGTTSTAFQPIHTYDHAGSYTVTLEVYKDNCNSRQTEAQYVRVDTAYAAFNGTTPGICMPMQIQYHDLSNNAVSWSWMFSNGDTSTLQNPQLTVSEYVYRPVRLAIIDVNGCRDTATADPFAPLTANFTADQRKGCIPHTVQFRNRSAISSHYLWDFGDGTTSTDVNPQHTYTVPGVYDVTLISWTYPWLGGCSDTLRLQAFIQAVEPVADFSTTDLYACAPSLVRFQNLSVFADDYLWDFGDSTTSTNDSASHIYEHPGIYSVKLIASSGAGCADSVVRQQYIRVLGPMTDFRVSAYEGCAPFRVDFTDRSLQAASWMWTFGDGTSDTLANPNHIYEDTGSFTVALVTYDTAGCSSFHELEREIVVHPSPVAAFTIDSLSGCLPFTVQPVNLSEGYTSLQWEFGDGDLSSDTTPVHQYGIPGQFPVSLVALNSHGCSDTAYSLQPVEGLLTPIATFVSSDAQGCAPVLINFQDQSFNTSNSSYVWDFGNGNTSANPFSSAVYALPGTYTVSLSVTNDNGCSSTGTQQVQISAYDTLPPSESHINSVSVRSNTAVDIVWEINPAPDLAAYVLYRLNAATNFFEVIHVEQNISNTGFTLTTSYSDTGLNTLANTYTYKLQAIDHCGYSIPLEYLTAHTTVNVSAQPAGSAINVSWTPYQGCPVSSYEVFRCEAGQPYEFIGTVDGNTLEFIDSTFICPTDYSYRILATDLCGNAFNSYSDTALAIPAVTVADQVAGMVRSTVVDNLYVLTEWLAPTVLPEKVIRYDIYRSTDNSTFEFQESVLPEQTSYMDLSVDVQKVNYYYRIHAVNACNLGEAPSGTSSTVVLDGEMDEEYRTHLHWTPYTGWENGVEYYVIEKREEDGSWRPVRQVNGNTISFDFQE